MKRRYDRRNRNRRSSRTTQGAQAVLEMAMVLPVMIALVFNFLGIMVEVKDQNQLQTAVSLAAQSTLAAPVKDTTNSCRYASSAFWSTVYAKAAGASAACPGGAAPSFSVGGPAAPPQEAMVVQGPGLTCTGVTGTPYNYLDGTGYPILPGASSGPPVRCTATVKFNFNTSPLGAFVLWTPTFVATAEAVPTTVRQCNVSLATC